jgi:hypothetical protein
MRMLSFICSLLVVGSTAITAWGADLSKIDRAVAKEPVYKGRPEYCLLVFGPAAETRVWLVRDGGVLYVDRNGNGDLTEEGEEVKAVVQRPNGTSATEGERVELGAWEFAVGAVREGKLKHDALVVEMQRFADVPKEGKPRVVGHTFIALKLEGKRQQTAYGRFAFARRPQDAPVVHFNGPLTILPRCNPHENQVLKPWGSMHKFRAAIGTPGLGNETFAFLDPDAVPAGIHPVAEVEFPAASADAQPVRARFVLERRC